MQSKGSQKKWNSKILLENYYWKIALILCVCKRYESWLVSIYVLESVWDSCEGTNGKMAQGYKEKKNYRNHFKGCFSEGKVWRGKFIVEPAMGKQVIWRGKHISKMSVDYQGKNVGYSKVCIWERTNPWDLKSERGSGKRNGCGFFCSPKKNRMWKFCKNLHVC